jgi:hypothetical protein
MQYRPERAEAALRFSCGLGACGRSVFGPKYPVLERTDISMVSRSDRRFCRGALRTSSHTSSHLVPCRTIPCRAGRHHLDAFINEIERALLLLAFDTLWLWCTPGSAPMSACPGNGPRRVVSSISYLLVRAQYPPLSFPLSISPFRSFYLTREICTKV